VAVDLYDLAQPSVWVVRWADRVPAGGRVLDLACGRGRHARFFAARGHPVEAVDRDPEKLAALGWGTHEKHFPPDGRRHGYGCDAAIYLERPGMSVKVRSWTPSEGPYHGFLITHGEAISIADYFTLCENGRLVYRPTCHYAYHPCDDAVLSNHEIAGKNWVLQPKWRIFASAALDLLLFDWLQHYGDTRRLWKDFRRNHAELSAGTGLKAFHP
jgi:SAM-dependent methyltransferase